MELLRVLGAVMILAAPFLWGFPFYYALVSARSWLYLKSFREKLRHFVFPLDKPRFMMLVKRLDGRVDIYYDDSIRFSKSEKTTVIWAGSETFRTSKAPDDFPQVPLVACFAPTGVFSPYGIAVRIIAGWYVATMMSYIYGISIMDWLSGLDALGWITLLAFIMQLAYTFWLFNAVQSVPVTHKAEYIEVGFDPPYHVIIPDFGVYSSEPVDRAIRQLGGVINIILPSDLKDIFDEIKKRLGSAFKAVTLLMKVYEADLWRKALSEYRETEVALRELGKSYARRWVLQHSFRITIPRLLVLVFVFALGVIVGYVFGSSWAVTMTPPPWYNKTTTTPVYQPQATATVTPATPPPPPGATQTPTVTPAQPPPVATATPTVTPAPMPQPPQTQANVTR